LCVVLIASAAIDGSVRNVASAVGVDLYHPWGVANAGAFSETPLGSPYLNEPAYLSTLNQHVEQSGDRALMDANKVWRHRLLVTATPFFYTCFSVLPEDFTTALRWFQLAHVLAFLAAIALLVQMCGGRRLLIWLLPPVLLISFEPWLSDFRVSNVNALQFLAAVLLIGEANRRLGPSRSKGETGWPDATALLVIAGSLCLFKPNFVIVAGALVGYVAVQLPWRQFLIGAGVAAMFGGALAAMPCLYFAEPDIWLHWYARIYGGASGDLLYPIEWGNYGTIVLLGWRFGLGISGAFQVVTSALVLSFLGVVAARVSRKGLKGPEAISYARRLGRGLLAEPWLVASAAATITLAVAPLAWFHYYVLVLLPGLWLVVRSPGGRLSAVLGATAVLLCGVLPLHLGRAGSGELAHIACAVSWLALWGGVLSVVARIEPERETPPDRLREQPTLNEQA
jgi:hypothetical protein